MVRVAPWHRYLNFRFWSLEIFRYSDICCSRFTLASSPPESGLSVLISRFESSDVSRSWHLWLFPRYGSRERRGREDEYVCKCNLFGRYYVELQIANDQYWRVNMVRVHLESSSIHKKAASWSNSRLTAVLHLGFNPQDASLCQHNISILVKDSETWHLVQKSTAC